MNKHSERQREILRKIGVEVWKFREAAAEVDEVAKADVSANTDTTAESAESAESAEIESRVDSHTDSPEPAAHDHEHEHEERMAEPRPAYVTESVDARAQSVDESLIPIEQEVSACRQCELHQSRTQTVFGCGNPDANWLFIGEAPGKNEDLQGEPFVGRAGKLLDKMIAALGMEREQVFIANVLKCRPPDNRDPLPGEIEQCEPYLHRQLAVIKPKVIVALGRISAQALLKTSEPLSKLRGPVHQYGPDNIPLVATYHPAYLLRSPGQKAKAWEDLWQAKMIAQQ